MTNRFRVKSGIPREARKRYLASAEGWCEYHERFNVEGKELPDTKDNPFSCFNYRHYVRCTEHEYCHCTGDTLILICERCWPKVSSEIRRKEYAESPSPELRGAKRPIDIVAPRESRARHKPTLDEPPDAAAALDKLGL